MYIYNIYVVIYIIHIWDMDPAVPSQKVFGSRQMGYKF